MKKTLIIFDIDGTLLYSNKTDSRCFAETYEDQFGEVFPSINWLDYPHVTDHSIFKAVYTQQFGKAASSEELNEFKNVFVERLKLARKEDPSNFKEVPGATNTLSKLQNDARFTLGIATGGFESPARLKLQYLGINTEGFHMSFADEKPTRESIIRESMEKARSANGDFEHIVYIGDAIWDVRTTRNLQMNFVGIRRKGDAEFLLDAGAQAVLKDYLDFEGFLNAVNEAQPPHKQEAF